MRFPQDVHMLIPMNMWLYTGALNSRSVFSHSSGGRKVKSALVSPESSRLGL